MSEDLLALAAGHLPAAVVPACRLEGFGVETFGREAIGALVARYPAASDDWLTARTGTAVAVGGAGAEGPVLFADLHDGMIVRIWRLGAAVGLQPVSGVDVAADDDLHQSRRLVLFDAPDHPALTGGGAAAIVAAAERAAAADFGLAEPPLRSRVFVRRAFSDGASHVALFGLSVLANGARRQPIAFNMLAWCEGDAPPRLLVDRAGLAAAQAKAWAPHL